MHFSFPEFDNNVLIFIQFFYSKSERNDNGN